MKAINTITLIGAGRVAFHLGQYLAGHGFDILQVYSRTLGSAKKLAEKLDAEPVDDILKIRSDAGLYIFAVVDDAIETLSRKVDTGRGIAVHTSGSVPMEVLKPASQHFGVLYPLQSFSHGRDVDFKTIPLCVEASDPQTEKSLTALAGKLSDNVRMINSNQRARIHLAAVFASNFSNLMYLMADDLLREAGVDFNILLPLISETAARIRDHQPARVQTGPARRNDVETLRKHLDLLRDTPNRAEIYHLLSMYIRQYFEQ